MSTRLRPWTTVQDGVVAVWQLRAAGWTSRAIELRTAGLRRPHRGVVVTGDAPLTDRQLLWASALSAPARCVSHGNAAAAFGWLRMPYQQHVTEAGSGGIRRHGRLVVHRSLSLHGHVGNLRGLPITSPARTLIDLEPGLDDAALGHLVRDALRLGPVTCAQLQVALMHSPPRKRPRRLAALAAEYARLSLRRARSDAEAHALALFAAGGRPLPRLNAAIAGRMADLSRPARRLIIELDSREFHQFPAPGRAAARGAPPRTPSARRSGPPPAGRSADSPPTPRTTTPRSCSRPTTHRRLGSWGWG